MAEPTKTVTMRDDSESGEEWTETTTEHLSSVELGMTAKGEPQIKSVKVYASTAQEAGEKAMVTLVALQNTLTKWVEQETE